MEALRRHGISMKKIIDYLFVIVCAAVLAVSYLLYNNHKTSVDSELQRQQNDIANIETQLDAIPVGYVDGFGDSDTINTNNNRLINDTNLMNQMWQVAFNFIDLQSYGQQRESLISTYALDSSYQFLSEGMMETGFNGLTNMQYLKQDVQLLSISQDVYHYFVRIGYYTNDGQSSTAYRYCYVLCNINADKQITNLKLYTSKGWQ